MWNCHCQNNSLSYDYGPSGSPRNSPTRRPLLRNCVLLVPIILPKNNTWDHALADPEMENLVNQHCQHTGNNDCWPNLTQNRGCMISQSTRISMADCSTEQALTLKLPDSVSQAPTTKHHLITWCPRHVPMMLCGSSAAVCRYHILINILVPGGAGPKFPVVMCTSKLRPLPAGSPQIKEAWLIHPPRFGWVCCPGVGMPDWSIAGVAAHGQVSDTFFGKLIRLVSGDTASTTGHPTGFKLTAPHSSGQLSSTGTLN